MYKISISNFFFLIPDIRIGFGLKNLLSVGLYLQWDNNTKQHSNSKTHLVKKKLTLPIIKHILMNGLQREALHS